MKHLEINLTEELKDLCDENLLCKHGALGLVLNTEKKAYPDDLGCT